MIRIRVAACLVKDRQILLVTHQKDDRSYHLLPGGEVDDGETLTDALVREVAEETGLTVIAGRLLIMCESIDPAGGRHILNLVFASELAGGTLVPGVDGTLCDVGWYDRDQLTTMNLFPDIGSQIEQCWDDDFAGPVMTLGNVWRSNR